MKNFWPIRNITNLGITLIGGTTLGLVYYSISNQRVYSRSPIVNEAIKILSNHATIKNLIGMPITYSGSFQNTYNINEEQQYYNFEIKGSQNRTTAELNSTRMQISEMNKLINQVEDFQKKIIECEQTMNKLAEVLKDCKGKKKEQVQAKVKSIQIQLNQTRKKHDAAKTKKIECLKKFYIPIEDLYEIVARSKNSEKVVQETHYLFGIDALSVKLPNKSVLNIVPESQQTRLNLQIKKQQQKKLQQVKVITESYIKHRLDEGLENLSEQELQNYSKHKTNLMYGKYNSYRVGISILIAFGLISLVIFWHNNRLRPVAGTLIERQAQNLILGHEKTIQLIKALKKQRKDVGFTGIYEGGKNMQKFKCSVEIQGIPGGRAFFEGQHIDQQNKITFKKVAVQYREGKQMKKIDLIV